MTTTTEATQTPETQSNDSGYINVTFSEAATPADTTKIAFSKAFHIKYTDPDTEQEYSGVMTMRRLNIGQTADMGVVKARLNGGLAVDAQTDWINEMRAYLTLALVKPPEWLDLNAGYDLLLLSALYNYVQAWESSFRRKALERRRG